MIQWWQPPGGEWLIRNYAGNRGKEIANRIVAADYEALSGDITLTARVQLFGGLDQLSVAERNAVAEVWDQISADRPTMKLLNDPRRVRTRFELLRHLHNEGVNKFRVFHAAEADKVDRFPVFVRSDRRHDGPQTDLITSSDALHRSIRALRARGEDLNDLMIVEYVDARDDDGLYRKYAAFRVGDRVLPSHVLAQKHWMVKAADMERTMQVALDERRFRDEGLYNDWIRRVFDLAGIDYGRLDFGVVRGVPQAWEINMHPTIGRGRGTNTPREPDDFQRAVEKVRAKFHADLRAVFIALDDDTLPDPAPLTVRLSAPVREALARQRRLRQRRSHLRTWLKQIYHAPRFGRVFRWAYRSLLPRG